MASYDSDSSDGEFEETNVLLGYASRDADDDTISKLGGRPVCCNPTTWRVPKLTLFRIGLARCRQRPQRRICPLQGLQGPHGLATTAQR